MGTAGGRAVFLDRDGTINVDSGYLHRPEQLELLPGAIDGLQRLSALGLLLVVVTNQSGVARGYFEMAAVEAVHARLREMLSAEGIALAGIYVCPHGPDDGCPCRKPRPGLIHQAQRDLGLEASGCFMIGDKRTDYELGQAIGARTILVRGNVEPQIPVDPTARTSGPGAVVDNLVEAAEIIRGWIEDPPVAGDPQA